jgi:NOL1/NOP2/sun family putative RNA methylase
MLPQLFTERLSKIIPPEKLPSVLATFDCKRSVSLRVNPLKGTRQEFLDELQVKQIPSENLPWFKDGFILPGVESTEVSHWEASVQGKIYIQSCSSMLPAMVLNPQAEEIILDLCAAPGSKTSQMAALMGNHGRIIAVEPVRARFFRLKSVIHLLDVRIVETKCLDGRRFRPERDLLFDRILVDAPCSSEGRFKTYDKKTIGYWSPRKIKEMVHKQRGLLLNACRMLKPGGVLVYATCTFAPEENEGVVNWVLRKADETITVDPIALPDVELYPSIVEWEGKSFDPRVAHCCRVLPTERMEGFFMAKLVKQI